MGDEQTVDSIAVDSDQSTTKTTNFKRRAIIGIVLLVCAGIAWVIGGAVLPRWWSHRIGDIVDGRVTFGGLFGFGLGAIFTILPLLALRAGWKFRAGWKRWLKFVAFALILAAPNLLTLGIVVGSGSAAHAGERTLDVDGPGVRGGSLVGAICGAVIVATLSLLLRSRRKNKALAKALKSELASRDSEQG